MAKVFEDDLQVEKASGHNIHEVILVDVMIYKN